MVVSPGIDLLTPLRRYWGYSSFRPLQERIVQSLLAGRDTCVVMPTGGGKSLCYQLPAVVSERTTVVISPLIALMQDQAAQLSQMGIPAAVLNSAVTNDQQSRIMRKAREGAFRLLYLSPERLQRADTLAWLQQVPVAFFAIDEAHCISEWGHEFRPEYRQLSSLRGKFPDRPIAAFTASATQHVRHDILAQLQLRDPAKYIASFHRPNLRYLIRESNSAEHSALLVHALSQYGEGNVIVYSPTISKVEGTVDFLGDRGIDAVGYHAKMDSAERKRNQERWMAEEVRVLVGTVAFGLGINKANVRAVIHLALPKSLEQFYQEAGRAGRDGKPADCIMLWRKQDAGLLAHFATQILDAAERERAWQRYHTIRDFAESKECRHRRICKHFGETSKWISCGSCDICGAAPEWLTGAIPATVIRRGASRSYAGALAPAHQLAVDQSLREYLREWRRGTAKEQGVPAYVVLHDTSLDELCRLQPNSAAALMEVSGIGERKAKRYGEGILASLKEYREGARATAIPEKKIAPAQETLQLLTEGKTFDDIARIRGRQITTVVNTVAGLVERGDLEFRSEWIERNKLSVIEAACSHLGIERVERLKTLKETLPPEITYDEIRLVVSWLRRKGANNRGETSLSGADQPPNQTGPKLPA